MCRVVCSERRRKFKNIIIIKSMFLFMKLDGNQRRRRELLGGGGDSMTRASGGTDVDGWICSRFLDALRSDVMGARRVCLCERAGTLKILVSLYLC